MKRRNKAILGAAVLLAAAVGLVSCQGWPGRSRDNYLLRADAKDLKATVVTAHLDEPISPGKNVLWCSTFQLAWNEGCALLGEDIRLDSEPALVPVLNRKTASKDDLDEASYVAMAGWTPAICGDIDRAVKSRFGPDMGFQPATLSLPDGWFVAYAALAKDLRFATPFEAIKREILFAGKPVRCFGMENGSLAQGRQVLTLHENWDTQEVIVELKTTSPDDRLILAKIAPEATLGKTVDKAHALIGKASGGHTGHEDTKLVVPKLNFDLSKSYDELVGKRLKVAHAQANGMPVAIAAQNILFQLNEHGAHLRSKAEFAAPSAISVPAIFDGPFLILLERRGAKAPYFALWVDNAELLIPAD